MANWAWPHTPADHWARLVLTGGPFDGAQVAFLPPDTAAPVQIAWSGWMPWGFDACLYEWHGETTTDRGRTDTLVYRPSGRRVAAADVPPLVAETAEIWADGADLIRTGFDVPAGLMWPGV